MPTWTVPALKRYDITASHSDETRWASCLEAHPQGFRTVVDEATVLGKAQADYIRRQSGRQFTEHQAPLGVTTFTFPPGEQCFAVGEHRVPLERVELYTVRNGVAPYRHKRPSDWMDDLHTHTDRLLTLREKG